MAGMGPPPKAAGARARRNRVSTASMIKSDPELAIPDLPDHPKADDGRDWHALTLEWWSDVWTSPMGPEYDTSDRHGLFVLAMLVDDFWTCTSASLRRDLGAEIRLQGQRFGISPLDRRRLQWQIEATEDAQAKGRRRRGGEVPTPRQGTPEDAREVLRGI